MIKSWGHIPIRTSRHFLIITCRHILASNDNSSEVPKVVNVPQGLLAEMHAAHQLKQCQCLTLEDQVDPCISALLVRAGSPTDTVADRACRANLSNTRFCIVRVKPGNGANASLLSKHTLEAVCMTQP